MQEESTPAISVRSNGQPKAIRILLAITLFVNLFIGIGFIVLEMHGLRQDFIWKADFSVYYSEGLMIRDGYGSRIYDIELEKQYQKRVMDGRTFAGGILPFVYPPHVALIFVPFSYFPRQVAMGFWMAGQLLLLVYFLRMLRRLIPAHTPYEHVLITASILAFLPLFITISIGAFSLIILVCHMKIYLNLREGKCKNAGLWFGTGLLKPQHMMLPGVAFLAARRWRALLVTTLFGLALFVISSLILGWHIWPTYAQLVSTLTSYFDAFGFSPHKMYNFRGILTVLIGYDHGKLINGISTIALICSVVATFWIWNRPYEPEKPEFTLRMALTLLMGLFFNLHFYPQDALMLVGPAVLFYDYLGQRGLPRKTFAAVALCFPSVFLVVWRITRTNEALFVPVPVLVMTILGVCMARALYKEYQSGTIMVPNGIKVDQNGI